MTDSVTTFTNVVFSKRRPGLTWDLFKDVGIVTITPQAFSIVGKKKSLRIDAPFAAELFDNEALRWPMIRVAQSGKTMLPAKAYLVVRGAPRERGKDIAPAVREVMKEESMGLVEAINGSTHAPSRTYRAPLHERNTVVRMATTVAPFVVGAAVLIAIGLPTNFVVIPLGTVAVMSLISDGRRSNLPPSRYDPGPPAHERKVLSKGAWFCIQCRSMNEEPEATRCSSCDRRRDGY